MPITSMLPLIAAVVWVALAIYSAASREKFPKRGMRRAERLLVVGSVVLAAAFTSRIDFASLWKGEQRVTAAAAVGTAQGSCASLTTGMTEDEVRSRLGEPDEVRPNEETRGPGATVLVYRSSRCAVHLLDQTVELIE